MKKNHSIIFKYYLKYINKYIILCYIIKYDTYFIFKIYIKIYVLIHTKSKTSLDDRISDSVQVPNFSPAISNNYHHCRPTISYPLCTQSGPLHLARVATGVPAYIVDSAL